MLTPEQIKSLKPGDTLNLNNYPVSYAGVYQDGTINANDDRAEECCNTSCYFPVQYLSTPPKHDPTRLFKKGDRVTPKEVNGRHPGNRGVIFRVCQDEEVSGREIKLALDGHIGHITIDAAYLQLVTPIEELEPYSVKERKAKQSFDIMRENRCFISVPYGMKANGWYHTYDSAKATAEDECDRLNAEYQQKHQN